MNNEASDEMKEAMTKQETKYQQYPHHMHLRNNVERAIWTFNNHFFTRLATNDPDLPISEW